MVRNIAAISQAAPDSVHRAEDSEVGATDVVRAAFVHTFSKTSFITAYKHSHYLTLQTREYRFMVVQLRLGITDSLISNVSSSKNILVKTVLTIMPHM